MWVPNGKINEKGAALANRRGGGILKTSVPSCLSPQAFSWDTVALTCGPKLRLEDSTFYTPTERMGPGSKQMPHEGDSSVSLLRWNNIMAWQEGSEHLEDPRPALMGAPRTHRRPEPITGLAQCLRQGQEPLREATEANLMSDGKSPGQPRSV